MSTLGLWSRSRFEVSYFIDGGSCSGLTFDLWSVAKFSNGFWCLVLGGFLWGSFLRQICLENITQDQELPSVETLRPLKLLRSGRHSPEPLGFIQTVVLRIWVTGQRSIHCRIQNQPLLTSRLLWLTSGLLWLTSGQVVMVNIRVVMVNIHPLRSGMRDVVVRSGMLW